MTNKEIEEYYFEMFRRDYRLPDGDIEFGDKPDVVLRGTRVIGIEITNFFLQDGSLPESEQIQRRAREAAITRAQELYRARGGKSFELTCSFDRSVAIGDPSALACKIAELASAVEERETGQLWRDDFRHIPELSFVYLNAAEYPDAHWRISQSYDGAFMSLDRLKTIVEGKEVKARGYRPCDAYWLLVVVDFADRAQDQEIGRDSLANLTSEVFEKVIVYKTCYGHVVENL
jgi:hypothetical protein